MVVISTTEHRASASCHGQIQNEMFEAMMGVPAKFCPSPPNARNEKQEMKRSMKRAKMAPKVEIPSTSVGTIVGVDK
jgi:hypothetical protein